MHKLRSMTEFNYFEGSVDRGQGGESDVVEVACPRISSSAVSSPIRSSAEKANRSWTCWPAIRRFATSARKRASFATRCASPPRRHRLIVSKRETHTVPAFASDSGIRRAEERQQRKSVGRHQQRWTLW